MKEREINYNCRLMVYFKHLLHESIIELNDCVQENNIAGFRLIHQAARDEITIFCKYIFETHNTYKAYLFFERFSVLNPLYDTWETLFRIDLTKCENKGHVTAAIRSERSRSL